ncbi:MAG: hypothetical protein Q8O52_10705 [Sulfuritalea sp.]|nr:hypothetical protein [Sulfuritalea sp.]
MTYEERLDEVTTLIAEEYGLADEAAIAMVMRSFAGASRNSSPIAASAARSAHLQLRVPFFAPKTFRDER